LGLHRGLDGTALRTLRHKGRRLQNHTYAALIDR
jgi:hypothetical protein